MARRLAPGSPLPQGSSPLQGRGLTLSLGAATPILHLEGLRRTNAALADHGPIARLPAPGRCAAHEDGVILSIGPQRYLCVGELSSSAALQHLFEAALDLSSAWVRFAIEGQNAVALLRKGCAVDLHPRQFPAGSCAATGFARLRSVLWRVDRLPRYDLLVARSHALSLWEFLSDAAAEFGCVAHNSKGAE